MADAKKPSLALLIAGLGKGKMNDDDEDDYDSGEYSAAVEELADALDVADDKREAFSTAFRAAVKCCK